MSGEEESEKTPEPKDGVPRKLVDELHDANQRLSKAREHVDRAIDAEVNSMVERQRAIDDVRAVEKDLENLDVQIHNALNKTP